MLALDFGPSALQLLLPAELLRPLSTNPAGTSRNSWNAPARIRRAASSQPQDGKMSAKKNDEAEAISLIGNAAKGL